MGALYVEHVLAHVANRCVQDHHASQSVSDCICVCVGWQDCALRWVDVVYRLVTSARVSEFVQPRKAVFQVVFFQLVRKAY